MKGVEVDYEPPKSFMNKFDELFALGGATKWSFTQKDIKRSVQHFQLGDKVIIPKEISDTGFDTEAVVKQICSAHIVFQLKAGYCRSYINIDCMKIKVIEKAKTTSGNIIEQML